MATRETADLSAQFQLELTVAELRKKATRDQPNWHAMTGLYIDMEQQQLLTKYVVESNKKDIIEKSGPLLARTLLGLLSKLESADYKRYILALTEEVLESSEENIKLFVKLQHENPKLPVEPFFHLLREDTGADLYVTYANTKILTLLLSKVDTFDASQVKTVFEMFGTQLADFKEKRVPVLALKNLLTRDEYRPIFVATGGLQRLAKILNHEHSEWERLEDWTPPDLLPGTPPPVKKGDDVKPAGANPQLIYEIFYCCWLVSYQKELAETAFTKISLISAMVSLIKDISKEKVKRIGLACLKNLSPYSNNNVEMISANFHNVLKGLNIRKWGDVELQEDLEALSSSVEENIMKFNSFDKFAAEVGSGKLLWTTPSHKSDKFWKQNAPRFEAEDFRVLRQLRDLLLKKDDPDTVALALHDIGEFARFHPRGKMIVAKLDIKGTVMGLIADKNEKIAANALLCIQKLMVHNWEYLTR